MKVTFVEARDLPDLWFQAIYKLVTEGRRFKVDSGSFAGQDRIELDFFFGKVIYPKQDPLLPDIPSHIGIPNPVEHDYVFGGLGHDRSYVEYVMTPFKRPNEAYTYGERLTKRPVSMDILEIMADTHGGEGIVDLCEIDGQALFCENGRIYINQIEWAIRRFREHGHRTNQVVLQVAQPSDCVLVDPPCLRAIDCRIQDGALHFFVNFRSWDAWGAMSANLAAIQTLKEYMACCIGVEDGEMIVESKGLHVYDYAERLARMRCYFE